MPSPVPSKAMWKATSYVLVIRFISIVGSYYLWYITVKLPEELIPEGVKSDGSSENYRLWLWMLPKSMMWTILTTPFIYRWQHWLERKFPGRRRGDLLTSSPPKLSEKSSSMGSDDEREEEIMQRLIAKGKVQRVGFSWINTLIKWTLDTFVMGLFLAALFVVFEAAWNHRQLSRVQSNLKRDVIPVYLFGIFAFDTVARFIAFVTVPVQHRLPFLAFSSLIWSIFIGASLRVFVPFVLSRDIVQRAIRKQTEAARLARNATANNQTIISSTSMLQVGEL